MTPSAPQQIQLSVEEGFEFQKHEAELRGFQAGIMAALDFCRRQKVQSILDSRKVPVPQP